MEHIYSSNFTILVLWIPNRGRQNKVTLFISTKAVAVDVSKCDMLQCSDFFFLFLLQTAWNSSIDDRTYVKIFSWFSQEITGCR